ncbi:hypothetical protein A6V39_00765 [Candidatus Mycoplasma haematobovis]|uniref:Uncharacterized protein n=1 Tax=Candidatus Mycoplasma haematobovis TaxID=432608 RepID=A0A1A9QDN9_9MOLU|nr:hypothetical protein [Candidatus Mycoplasma haematobovis]OAL10583.1 hypothetical protein A6V39_00765 [Candidatus Mycoplasma haematobovis]
MGLVGKIGSVVGVLGALGGGVATVSYLNRDNTTIEDTLKKVGYQILDNTTSELTKVLTAYKEIPNKETVFGEIANENGLLSKCQEILKQNDKKNYPLARRWCVKEETMDAMLKRNSYTPIGASGQDGNNAKWQAKVTLLKKDKNNEMKLTLGTTNDVDVLEKACQALQITQSKTHASDDFEEKYIKASKWCSEK